MTKRKAAVISTDAPVAAPQAAPEAPADEKEDCVICLGSSAKKGKLKCSHTFCFDCIKDWAQHENTCPLCKHRFTEIEQVDEAISNGKGRRQKVRVKRRDQAQTRESDVGMNIFGMLLGINAPNHRILILDDMFPRRTTPEVGIGSAAIRNAIEDYRAETRRRFQGNRTAATTAAAMAAHNPTRRTAGTPIGHNNFHTEMGGAARQRRRQMYASGTALVDLASQDDITRANEAALGHDEVVLTDVRPTGATPSQMAARMLRDISSEGEVSVINLVDEGPRAGSASSSSASLLPSASSSSSQSQSQSQSSTSVSIPARPTRHARGSDVTVLGLGARFHPLSPVAAAATTHYNNTNANNNNPRSSERRRARAGDARVWQPIRGFYDAEDFDEDEEDDDEDDGWSWSTAVIDLTDSPGFNHMLFEDIFGDEDTQY